MQVECDIGVAGMAQQQALQGFELRQRGRQLVQHLEHGAADQGHVGRRVIRQQLADPVADRATELDEGTVEVVAAAQLEAPQVIALHLLVEADGIGHRHQFHRALQAPLFFQ